jgi:hypothetical protein
MKPTRLRSRKRSKSLRKRTQRRKIRGGGDLKEDAIAAIPDVPGRDKLNELLLFIINHPETGYVHKININGKTYIYEFTRGMSMYNFKLMAYEKSNPSLRVVLYEFDDY